MSNKAIILDYLHDMGDQIDAALCAVKSLKQGEIIMIVNLFANGKVEDNLNL